MKRNAETYFSRVGILIYFMGFITICILMMVAILGGHIYVEVTYENVKYIPEMFSNLWSWFTNLF
jgi:hypothetical protein